MTDERPPIPPEKSFSAWDSAHTRRDNPHAPPREFDQTMWDTRGAHPKTGEAETDAYEERKQFFTDLGAPEEES